MENLKGKLFISGKIELKTGLHIGGSSTSLNIGGIDSNVIKTSNGVPYIPGSSLKGKMRTLIGLSEGKYSIEDDTDEVKKIFGIGSNDNSEGFRTRLIIRDSYLNIKDFEERKDSEFSELELEFTEGKWENVIDRKTSSVNPRQLERVPNGVKFDFNMVYNIFDEKDIDNLNIMIAALRLLQDDYLGGSGSRGYGQIEIKDLDVKIKKKENYERDNKSISIDENIRIDKEDNSKFIDNLKKVLGLNK